MRSNEKKNNTDQLNDSEYKNEYDPNLFLIPQNDEMLGSGAQNIKLKKYKDESAKFDV